MTTRFRIEQFRVETVEGPVIYDFPDDLTVLAGDTGVGKTTLFELIKFALGGNGLVAQVAAKNVSEVHLSVRVEQERLQLSRAIDRDQRKNVRVTDLITGDVRHSVPVESKTDETVSDILMSALGLPTTMLAAARGAKSSRKGAAITFYDLFKFMYVPQKAINQEIAGSRDKYYEPKRKSVFELLFGLTNAEILEMQSDLNVLNGKVSEAKREFDTVAQFLSNSGMQARMDADIALADAISEERRGRDALDALADEVEEAVDRETQVLREMLTDSERSLADAQDFAVALNREHQQYRTERHQVQQDVDRLRRMASAGDRLASIEFVVCPRCTQSITEREVPEGACRVCLQHDNIADLPGGQYETGQLTSQIEEIDRQLEVIAAQSNEAVATVTSRRELVASLTSRIEVRTANRITPRLQAYTDAVARAERAKEQQRHLEYVLQQWDRADDLGRTAEELLRQRSELTAQIRAANSAIERRRVDVLDQLTEEFAATVADFRIPAGQGASIDPKTYLPLLNGEPFDEVTLAGGIATATQVAYWMSLVAVATRLNDTLYPAFLMIDSPRLAVSSTEDITGQMYARFVTQVGVTNGRLQFIVADNELPKSYGREFTEFKFSYDDPTISTIAHPGPAEVKPIHEDTST